MTNAAARRPRGPGYAFAGLALVLLLLVGVFAFTARQPPPPTIAEFAPQAVENITDSPADQSSSTGRGAGAGGGGSEPTPAPLDAPAPAIDVPRVRRCVGDPPRQIEDPQSPPCVPFWSGDNGGATTTGVTRDEIRVVVTHDALCEVGSTQGGCTQSERFSEAIKNFFNKRFEFYGRKINLVYLNVQGGDDAEQRSHAETVAASNIFMSLHANSDAAYYEELARKKILSVSSQPVQGEEYFRGFAPYQWEYPMAVDRIQRELGSWICGRFAGGNAVHAGTPDLRQQKRVFGLVYERDKASMLQSPEPAKQTLRGCGEEFKVVIDTLASSDNQAANTILQMKNAGVTDVALMASPLTPPQYMSAATAQGFFPEWLFTTYYVMDVNGLTRATYPQDQWRNAMGLSVTPMAVRRDASPFTAAINEADPGFAPVRSGADVFIAEYFYRTFLLVASGIQMAGPALTPQTFDAGLHRSTFPNPVTSLQAGSVGFGPGEYSMTQDVAEVWWSQTAIDPRDGTPGGAHCYIDQGARKSRVYPPGDPFFQQPCFSGLI